MFRDPEREKRRKRAVQARAREARPWVQWYLSGRWRRERYRYLRAHPTCDICGGPSCVIDHLQPHRGNLDLFWAEANWRPMCKTCHDRKTAAHDGGFGNPARPAGPSCACDEDGQPLDPAHPWRA